MTTLSLTVTTAVIASVALVSVAAWISKGVWRALILNPYLVRQRFEVHRLLTAGWIHADASHLIFNMLTLYLFADRVISVLGPTLFLVLYVSAVVVAHLPTTLRHMGNPKERSPSPGWSTRWATSPTTPSAPTAPATG